MVKPMSTKLRHIDMFSGNTILGDGAVIMIIDPNGIAKALGTSVAASPRDRRRERGIARRRRRAIDLAAGVPRRLRRSRKRCRSALVTRLEEIAADKIELSNGRYMVQYRDQLMPLVQMAGVNVATSGVAADPGVRRRRPLDGPRGRRDHRHRRGAAQYRGRRQRRGHSRLGRDQGPGHRSDRCRPLPADGVRRLVQPQGDAALGGRAIGAAGRRQRVLPQHAGAGA